MDPASANGVGIPLAVIAGLVSFLSPCVLPLVPGYISTVAGVRPDQARDRGSIRQVLGPSLLFVLSFSTIFILLGLSATAIGASLQEHRETLQKVSAGVIIVLGVFFLAAPFVTNLNREFHVSGLMQRAGRGGPMLVGAAFAIAWTPCIGPTLGAILSTAALSQSASKGAILLAFYSAGLAIPFLLTAVAFGRMTTAFSIIKRHYGLVIGIGGAVLIAMGVLIWTGEFFRLNVEAQNLLNNMGLDFWNSV
ncbi:MAG TPA: cytochrome c biogenesis protein CcdA [Conexibacter sp.]|jgi:cytochrome c-type biogenesis protein